MGYPLTEMQGVVHPPRILSWLLVCRSRDVPVKGIRSLGELGYPIVLFRTAAGRLHALSRHCTHMGSDLSLGRVVSDCLQCPLHRWEFDGEGECRRRPSGHALPAGARQGSFPVVERHGAVFLFPAAAPAFPFPSLSEPDAHWTTTVGPPVRLSCSWKAIGANVFDMEHLQSVHDRALWSPPEVEQPHPHCLRLRYATRITGEGLADRLIRWANQNRVEARIECWGGTVLVAENPSRRVRSVLLLGVLPLAEGVQVTPVFGIRRSGIPLLDRLRVRAARALIQTFLDRDVRIMDGMVFHHSERLPDSEPLARYLAFLEQWEPPPAMRAR